MKKILAILCAAITAASAATAAEAQKYMVKVGYQEKYTNWSNNKIVNDFVLLIGNEESRYFNPVTQVVDSMLSTPQGTADFNNMVAAANAAGQRPTLLPRDRTYIIKYPQKGEMLCYEETAGELGNYTEPFSEQSWSISDSIKTVLDYECIMAETDYHGRHWTAWFTLEIPINNGPWKFCGLPGLILEATADNGAYNFIATGLEQTDAEMPRKIYGHDLSEKMDRKNMREICWTFYTTCAAQMKAQYGVTIKEVKLPDGFDLIETDYK